VQFKDQVRSKIRDTTGRLQREKRGTIRNPGEEGTVSEGTQKEVLVDKGPRNRYLSGEGKRGTQQPQNEKRVRWNQGGKGQKIRWGPGKSTGKGTGRQEETMSSAKKKCRPLSFKKKDAETRWEGSSLCEEKRGGTGGGQVRKKVKKKKRHGRGNENENRDTEASSTKGKKKESGQ